MLKRVISLLLVLVMLTGMLPVFAQAQEEPTTSVDNGEITVQGTNGFGSLLAEDIAQAQETMEEQENAGYTLTDLQITGNTATVTYDSLEEATVVVAIYTEDGMQMVTSGQTTVIPEETTATVTIDGEMPQYFMASAYLLDSYDMSPLCPAYDNPLYTKEMQELLNSTAEDYDPDRVLQLEESPETNFAVYAETTKVIERIEGVNTVSSVNKETNTYVIENADDSIISLQIGDTISYPYAENEILIVKVASITVEGTTVTITGGELELQDVFSHVKIEGASETEDITVDDSTAYEGITYEGMVAEGAMTRAVTGGASEKVFHKFEFNQKIEEETDRLSASLSVGGYFKAQLDVGVNYYVSWTKSYVEFKTSFSMTAGLSMDGHISGSVPIGTFGVSPCPGVFVGFEPKLVLKFTGTMDVTVTFDATVGFRYDNETGLQNISTTPKVTPSCTVEATLFLGVDFAPKITILGDDTLKIGLSATIGVELKVKVKGSKWEIPTGKETELHTCKECLDISLSFKASLSGSITFLDFDWMAVNIDIGKWEVPLKNAYYSLDDGNSGFGSCPNVKYRLTVTVTRSLTPVSEAKVKTSTGVELGTTNNNGVVIAYLPAGDYQLMTLVDDEILTKNIKVTKADSVKISSINIGNTGSSGSTAGSTTGKPNILQGIQPGVSDFQGFVDGGAVTASGKCGDNLNWTLYDSGTLHIYGSGVMWDYWDPIWYDGSDSIEQYAPWLTFDISNVIVSNGVTHIGDNIFHWNSSLTSMKDNNYGINSTLTSLELPNTVTSIGYAAFRYCINLTNVTIPTSVTNIENAAFAECESLQYVYFAGTQAQWNAISIGSGNDELTNATIHCSDGILGENVTASGVCGDNLTWTLDDSGTLHIRGSGAMADFEAVWLQSAPWSGFHIVKAIIYDGVTSIGYQAFAGCYDIASVTIPSSVTSIGESAFEACENLSCITIPNGVIKICARAFMDCTNLSNVTILPSVISIGGAAFYNCDALTSLTIPNSVTSIGGSAFIGCDNLTSVTIGNSVTSIGENTFRSCKSLTSVTIPSSVTSIGDYAFYGCSSFKNVYYTGTQAQWNAISIGSNNSSLTNATIHYNSTVSATMLTSNEMTVSNGSLSGLIDSEMTGANAVFGGDYGTAVENNVTVKTADFSNLVPGKDYVLLSLASIDADDPLSADNLLFIDQAVADENGCLSFRYLQRVNTDLSYVMVCGASNKDLNDAQITFPRMTADGETQIVQPVVVYDDKTLIEGQDYVISGDVDFTEAGEYTCYIRGIYNYTGLVTCTYQVSDVTIPTLTLKAPALEFKDMITVNAFFTAENIEDVVEMGMITYTEKVDVVDISTAAHVIPGADYEAGSGRYYASSQGINAKYLADTVYLACYAKLFDGTYIYTKLAPYSPITYATNQLKNSTNVPLKQLVAAMLNYGAAAQTYFNYNVENLANASLTEEQLALPEAYRSDMVSTVPAVDAAKQGEFANNKGFSLRKPTVSFEGAFSINYFFTPTYTPVGDVTLYYWTGADFDDAEVLTVENATGSVTLSATETEQLRGDITGIAAKNIAQAVYVAAVYFDGTTTWTSGVLGYSIGSYCSSQASKGGDIAALAKATAVYGYHAKAYFG